MNTWKTVLLCTWFVIGLLPVWGQTPEDSPQVIFRFVEGKDMFYVPWRGNGATLDSLCRTIDVGALTRGSVRVDGYSTTKRLSLIRCNRVKSELIVRSGLTEDHFTTTNNVGTFEGMRNVVVITMPLTRTLPPATPPADAVAPPADTVSPPPAPTPVDTPTPSADVPTRPIGEQSAQSATPTLYNKEKTPRKASSLALRANLLRWATLTSDLGLEWRVSPGVGLLVGASYASWSWNDKDRYYGLWEVAPEVRRYLGKQRRGYVGAMYKVGTFNYKLSDTGRQGNLMGGGITGGYVLRLSHAFALDFGLGLGYLRADYDEYVVINGVRVRSGEGDKNWWGPIHAGVTLVWTLF